jgi:hypothetical protein
MPGGIVRQLRTAADLGQCVDLLRSAFGTVAKEFNLTLENAPTNPARIAENGGTVASIALMDNNKKLKQWYRGKGFVQTGRRTFEHLSFAVCFIARKLTGESIDTNAGHAR